MISFRSKILTLCVSALSSVFNSCACVSVKVNLKIYLHANIKGGSMWKTRVRDQRNVGSRTIKERVMRRRRINDSNTDGIGPINSLQPKRKLIWTQGSPSSG